MSEIILIRHAKVLIDNNKRIPASQMKAWVEEYNSASIELSLPNHEVIALIKSADVILASSLSRTKDSLALLGVESSARDSLFDEAQVPSTKGSFLKLSPKSWLVVLRLLMFFRIGKNSDSLKLSKCRAKKAAAHLVQLSKEEKRVVLMGHGGMNWLVGKELEKIGYKLFDKKGGSKNWGYSHYIPK